MRTSSQITIAIFLLIFITLFFYWIDTSKAVAVKPVSPGPIHIAKPDWYAPNTNMEWTPAIILYNGEDYYYSPNSRPVN